MASGTSALSFAFSVATENRKKRLGVGGLGVLGRRTPAEDLTLKWKKHYSGGGVSMTLAVDMNVNVGAPHFEGVKMASTDQIIAICEAFRTDTSDTKLNLALGAYRTEALQPYVLDVVKKAEADMVREGENKEYLPIEGLAEFNKVTAELLFGAGAGVIKQGRVATVQGVSGTGALRLAAAFIKRCFPGATALISSPTWELHRKIFDDVGILGPEYRYYNSTTGSLDFNGMIADIKAAPPRSFVLLQACAHNPSGVDPTPEQWEKIADAIQEKNHVPFFDVAYQGFASGSLRKDAYPVRLFLGRGLELLAAQTYSKNMGLYGERIGALNVVCESQLAASRVKSQLKRLANLMYANPPVHGARIVARVAGDPALVREWEKEIELMVGRIRDVKKTLVDSLCARDDSGKDWSFILRQTGMFSFTGMNEAQSHYMANKWHVYMTKNGRICLAGLPQDRCGYVASAMVDAFHNGDQLLGGGLISDN